MTVDALPAPAPARPAPTRPALLAYAVAALVIAADQLSKWWVLHGLDLPRVGRIAVLPPVFDLTLVHNAGVSFGLLKGAELGRWLLTVFSLGVAVGLAWWVRRAERGLAALATGLIIGGAVGNAVDRVRLGVVTDFLDFSGLHFPWVFNGADSAICVGVGLLILDSVLPPRPAAPVPAAPVPDALAAAKKP